MREAVKTQPRKRFYLWLLVFVFALSTFTFFITTADVYAQIQQGNPPAGNQAVAAQQNCPVADRAGLDEVRKNHTYNAGNKILIDFNVYERRVATECGEMLNPENNGFTITNVYPNVDESRLNPPGPNARRDPSGYLLYALTSGDLSLNNWKITLNSSADTIPNRIYSYTRHVPLQDPDNPGQVLPPAFKCTPEDVNFYQTLTDPNNTTPPVFVQFNQTDAACTGVDSDISALGVRIHFPTHEYNAWASVAPPFEVRTYDENGGLINLENGIVNNTGTLKHIRITIAGRNFNNSIAVRLKDPDGVVKEYFMGYLYFNGWRSLVWNNPNYIPDATDRTLTRLPLYPYEIPYLAFDSFIIYRNGSEVGGDFVTYIKRVEIQYDLAVPYSPDIEEFNDEDIWGILSERAMDQAERDRTSFIDYIDLLEQERARMQGRAPEGQQQP